MTAAAVTLASSLMLVAAVIVGVAMRRRARAVPPASGHVPTVYELAAMVGGEQRVAQVAASFLVWNGVFEVRENTRRIVVAAPPTGGADFHPVEVAMVNAAGLEGAPATEVIASGALAAERVAASLPGLAVDRRTRVAIAAVPGVVGSATVLVLGWWMWSVSSSGGRLGWVPVVFGVAAVVAGLALIDPPYSTRAGELVVEERRTAVERDLEVAALGVTSLPLVAGMTVVALIGRKGMTGELYGLRNVTR